MIGPTTLGFAPAVLTLVVYVAVFATVVYGGVTLGKAIGHANRGNRPLVKKSPADRLESAGPLFLGATSP
jgi:hypothetical protein